MIGSGSAALGVTAVKFDCKAGPWTLATGQACRGASSTQAGWGSLADNAAPSGAAPGKLRDRPVRGCARETERPPRQGLRQGN
jgi:hypothetical protein